MRKQLQQAREEKGLSVAEVARKINVSTRYYRYIESGERTGSLPIIKKIAKVLDLNDINLF